MLRVENTIRVMVAIATWFTLVSLLAVALASAGSDSKSHAHFCGVNGFYSCFADRGPHLPTPLHLASFSGQKEMVGLFLAVSVDKAAKESLRPMPFPIPGFIGNYLV